MTPRGACLGLAGLVLMVAMLSGFRSASEVRALRPAPGLEYLVQRWDSDLQSQEHQVQLRLVLNALGKDGWELISGHVGPGTVMIFKRAK